MVAAGLGISAGCLFELDPQPDGADCESDDECDSGTCFGDRFCAHSKCTNSSYCEPGFVCEEPPLWQEVVSIGLVKNRCVPDCSLCPTDEDRWSCGDDRCAFDGRPRIDPGGPYLATRGEPVRLEATVELAPGRELAEVQWLLDAEVVGEELSVELVFSDYDSPNISVVVTDDHETTEGASVNVNLCSALGGACNMYTGNSDCCDPTHECRDDDGDGDAACTLPAVCGNGVLEGEEECEAGDAIACEDAGQNHPGGLAPCGDQCRYDDGNCSSCKAEGQDCFDTSDCCGDLVCDDFFERCETP